MNLLLVTALTFSLFQTSQDTTTVVINPERVTLEVGAKQLFRAAMFVNGEPTDGTFRWVTANADIVSISDDGTVEALAPGSARVAAVANGVPGIATITILNPPASKLSLHVPTNTVLAGTSIPVHIQASNAFGEIKVAGMSLSSSDSEVASVDATGRVVGVSPGTATISAMAGDVSSSTMITVSENPLKSYAVSEYVGTVRTGDVVRFRIESDGGDAQVYPAWSIEGRGATIESDGKEGVFVAEESGSFIITAQIGPEIIRNQTIDVELRTSDMKLVKVGRGGIGTHHSGDTWVFEGVDGRDYAYIGTFLYDWMKVFDITDPENPVLTDSLQLDARRINDVKIHPNNKVGIVTREGASDRKNGMVLLDLSNPANPIILSEYKETVTGGVHNVWIDGERDLVYACHNGTSDLHIIDISDPANPKEVGRWGLDKTSKTLHDAIVQEGYAYLSYWNDGVVILDVGAGTHGGSPTEPQFVSSYKYPEGNTHVAWRNGKYLYVGDEIFPPGWDPELPIEASGYIHVLDVSDLDNPIEVARYEVPEAGAHNIWAEDDKLYVGYYQGGLRVLDISGELRGDLYRQGREIAVLKTTDATSMVPNWPMTWGAQIFKGNIYTSDLNSGLWIAKLVPNPPIP